MIKVDKETPLNSLLSHLEEAWFLSVVGNEALLYGPGGETEGPWPQDVYEPLIKDGSLVAFADDKYVLRRYLDCADLLELWGGTVLAPWERPGSLLAVMQANPTAELVVTMDPGHPAYLRDSTNREKFFDGPFEQDVYQPLIDSGELVDSEEFCSVFVLATAATPPDFSELNFDNHSYAHVLKMMRKKNGSLLMGMAKTIDELYSPAERAEILSAFKIRIELPQHCEVESVLYSAPVRCGMSVCKEIRSCKLDAASVIERELTSGRCYLCVEKFSSGTRAVLASVKDTSTVAGPFLPSDYEFLQNSTDYKWTQYDDTTWFVVSSKGGDQTNG